LDEEIRRLAHQVVDKIARATRRESKYHFYRLGKTIGIGADGTPTSYIDKIAEDIAIKTLTKASVKVNLLSEEIGFIDFGGRCVFVLDPIDGTRNASRGIPFYGVSLAVGTSHISDVEYGIVKNIPTGDVFTAQKHHGAFLNSMPIRVCEMPTKDILASITLGKSSTKKATLLTKQGYVRSLGAASLEMCMVAIGALDYYFVGRDIMRVIDIAASTLIVREAGGCVKTVEDKDLDMGFDLAERTSVVAACSETVVREILS